ncbi:ATP-dependent DNA helicase RecG [Acidaminobacter sp. JC074]|uniref:ATP-dependent DNA helicase RecG n=1 Tax=Acidaminobacter sp. JC074 TaxID=2530199 RepID=UPI001F119375|nr:ATP-dependent DNA helicase RecG [Acidaminobacter sp. JC074]
MYLKSKLSSIKGIGPKKYELLNKLGLYTVEDFVEFYPRRYIDRRHIVGLSEIQAEMTCTVRAFVIDIQSSMRYGKKDFLKIKTSDGSFFMDVVFFNARYVSSNFKFNREYLFYGKVTYGPGGFTMTHPDFTPADKPSELFTKIQPVYPLTEGLSQKDMVKIAQQVFADISLEETLPDKIIHDHQLMPREKSVGLIHFPQNRDSYKTAKYRLVFEEFLTLQLGLMLIKSDIKEKLGHAYHMTKEIKSSLDGLIGDLPYEMTGAQKRVLSEIYSDMINEKVMNRLVQGDVGSGKTLLSMLAIYFAVLNGYQCAMMAPTEILAEQHFESFKETFSGIDVSIGLLTRSTSKSGIKEDIASGKVNIIIGTHALIQEDVVFNNLGLVVTDEQHRFGVNQRTILSSKGESPDVLVMTATPIPRTLSLILYGDIDISKVDEMPANRLPIKTSRVPEYKIHRMYDYIKDEVDKGKQAYFVYPLVEESDLLDLKSVTTMYETLSKQVFSGYKTGMIHGKMKASEKDTVMKQFEKNEIQILFATTVIEVGINVPNATIMVIEHAERFGLAQLHQLRGRVGRGGDQSYCFLVSEGKSDVTQKRLGIMCDTNDGFVIADKDLEIRGPGEVFGLKQHGLPEFKLADLIKNKSILEVAQQVAIDMMKNDEITEEGLLMKRIHKMFDQFTI